MDALTTQDGENLIAALNEVAEVTHRIIGVSDVYLHYRVDVGWRARFGTSSGANEWVAVDGPWSTGPVDAVHSALALVRKQLAQNAERRQPRRKGKA